MDYMRKCGHYFVIDSREEQSGDGPIQCLCLFNNREYPVLTCGYTIGHLGIGKIYEVALTPYNSPGRVPLVGSDGGSRQPFRRVRLAWTGASRLCAEPVSGRRVALPMTRPAILHEWQE